MKKMVVNCAICDMRNVTEETLQNYEQVIVNAATVLVTATSKELVNRFNVVMNTAEVLEVPDGENVRVNTQNGVCELTADGVPISDGKISSLSPRLSTTPPFRTTISSAISSIRS